MASVIISRPREGTVEPELLEIAEPNHEFDHPRIEVTSVIALEPWFDDLDLGVNVEFEPAEVEVLVHNSRDGKSAERTREAREKGVLSLQIKEWSILRVKEDGSLVFVSHNPPLRE